MREPIQGRKLLAAWFSALVHGEKDRPETKRPWLWNGMTEELARRAFALALAQLASHLEPEARAIGLTKDRLGLQVWTSSSATSAEIKRRRAALLVLVNIELGKMSRPKGNDGRPLRIRVRKIACCVADLSELAELPVKKDWQTPKKAIAKLPTFAADAEVEKVVDSVADLELRGMLTRLYSAATTDGM